MKMVEKERIGKKKKKTIVTGQGRTLKKYPEAKREVPWKKRGGHRRTTCEQGTSSS